MPDSPRHLAASTLFGLLFVITANNLWAVILCHGLYDRITFVRFARGQNVAADIDLRLQTADEIVIALPVRHQLSQFAPVFGDDDPFIRQLFHQRQKPPSL